MNTAIFRIFSESGNKFTLAMPGKKLVGDEVKKEKHQLKRRLVLVWHVPFTVAINPHPAE